MREMRRQWTRLLSVGIGIAIVCGGCVGSCQTRVGFVDDIAELAITNVAAAICVNQMNQLHKLVLGKVHAQGPELPQTRDTR